MELDKSVFNAHTKPMLSHINIGAGDEISINQLARLICRCVGYEGNLKFDASIPDGTPRKTLDCTRFKTFDFKPTSTSLQAGLALAYNDFLETTYAKSTTIRNVSKQNKYGPR